MEIWFVYLIISQKRLVIIKHQIDSDNDYHLLLEAVGINSKDACKAYCLGFISGQLARIKVINSVEEFK